MGFTGEQFKCSQIPYVIADNNSIGYWSRAIQLWNQSTNVTLYEFEGDDQERPTGCLILGAADLKDELEGDVITLYNDDLEDYDIASCILNTCYMKIYNEQTIINLAVHLLGYVMGLEPEDIGEDTIMRKRAINRASFLGPQEIDIVSINYLYSQV
ncbi:hypothetical protein [Chengkuizengella sediminis]|uniref:hypothetical protein n=1 Tax=Chengkuizengella sediminis TaxID=1885917 RepID=UPI001389F22D|nr:hypothetical protein [Chengkuizengella sediminis]NDI35177.1 hypothetical protein [Chengkuizengella sediminis]